MRLIDADAFDERVRAAGGMSEEELSEDFKDGVLSVLYMMSKQPAITAQPERKRGKWIVYKAPDQQHCGLVKCPFCGEDMVAETDEYNFCPNCGADMRGEQDDKQTSANND